MSSGGHRGLKLWGRGAATPDVGAVAELEEEGNQHQTQSPLRLGASELLQTATI